MSSTQLKTGTRILKSFLLPTLLFGAHVFVRGFQGVGSTRDFFMAKGVTKWKNKSINNSTIISLCKNPLKVNVLCSCGRRFVRCMQKIRSGASKGCIYCFLKGSARKGKNNKCEFCEKLIYNSLTSTRRFCSRKCYARSILYKGENVGYNGIHKWIHRKYGKARLNPCESCGTTGKTQWASKNHSYTRSRKDWMLLCPRCHWKYDNA